MFGSTTIIFVLATVVIIVGPGLTLQAIPGFITFIEPSINIGWSMHKIDVMTGIVAAVTRINVGFCFPSSGLLLRYNEWAHTQPVISDMVCAWRAVVLWKYDRRVVVVLSACIVGTFGSCAFLLYPGSRAEPLR